MDMVTPVERPTHLLGALRDRLGAAAVLVGTEVPARNCNDWSASLPQTPLAVIRPVDAQGVADAISTCRQAHLPFVPQGGLTGLCRGASPEAGWVAISLERMSGIEEIDHASMTMTVKAGTPLQTIQKAADEAGFFFPLDLGSRGSCAIGGNLSTNAGGNRVIRYGMTRELVLGLEVVLPDGTIITSLNKLMKNNAGYDLKHLFIGSEGTLGIITRVVLRLFPKPRSTMAALCALEDYAAVIALLGAARSGLGPLLSAFEVMWPDYWDVITTRAGVKPPVAAGHGLYVLVEAQGTDESLDAPRFQSWLEELMERGLLADAAVAQSLAQTQSFWRGARHLRRVRPGAGAAHLLRHRPRRGADGRVRQALQGGAREWHRRLRERLLRPYRRRQSASRLLGHRPCRRAAAEGSDGRDHLRSRARDGRQRLRRARHRHAEEEVAGSCPQ